MKKHLLAALVVLGVLVPSAAMADDKGAQYPMTAAAFQQKVDARQAKMKERVEARIKEHSVPDAKAAEIRAKVAEGQAKVAEAVKAAVADGTVTREEAQHVKEVAKAGRHGGHRGHGHGATPKK